MIATDINETFRYVPRAERDQPAEEQTVFVLRTFDAATRARIANRMLDLGKGEGDNSFGGVSFGVATGTLDYETVRHGVRDWQNLRTRDGASVPCQKTREGGRFEVLTEGSMNAIVKAIGELAAEIKRVNRVEEDDLGNSPPSPDSPPTAQAREDDPVAMSV